MDGEVRGGNKGEENKEVLDTFVKVLDEGGKKNLPIIFY